MCLKYEHKKWRHVFVKSLLFWYRPWRSNPNKRFFLGISGFSLMALLNCFLYCYLFNDNEVMCWSRLFLGLWPPSHPCIECPPQSFHEGVFKRFRGGDVGWKFTCRGIKISSVKPQDYPVSYSIFQTTLRNKLEGNFLCEDLLMVPCCHNWLGTIANWVQEWSNTLRYAGFVSRT